MHPTAQYSGLSWS